MCRDESSSVSFRGYWPLIRNTYERYLFIFILDNPIILFFLLFLAHVNFWNVPHFENGLLRLRNDNIIWYLYGVLYYIVALMHYTIYFFCLQSVLRHTLFTFEQILVFFSSAAKNCVDLTLTQREVLLWPRQLSMSSAEIDWGCYKSNCLDCNWTAFDQGSVKWIVWEVVRTKPGADTKSTV